MGESIYEDWSELTADYRKLESANENYLQKLKELNVCQEECLKHIAHQRYRINVISKNIKLLETNKADNKGKIEELKNEMQKREVDLQNIEMTLPRTGGKYLRVILGNIDVSFLDKDKKFKYKDEYEKFKLVSHIICFFAVIINVIYPSRILKSVYFFFLVWYYSTLSIRESILKTNGSRIKGWWQIHHIFSIITSAVLLIWPDNDIWRNFRNQLFYYNIYMCLLQYLQFKYQKGTLYRLKALGKRDNMDITIEGFHSWMWRGLSFLLPFLFIGYVFQIANAVKLITLCQYYEFTWHAPVMTALFMILFVGNTATTIMVIPDKLKKRMINQYRLMTFPTFGNFGKDTEKTK